MNLLLRDVGRRAAQRWCFRAEYGEFLVLVCGRCAAHAHRADHMAVYEERHTALQRNGSGKVQRRWAASGRPSALHLARAVPLQGGVPLLVDGHVIGAVGVSGASSADEDQELAVLGSEAPSLHSTATYIPKQKVHEQFQTGGLLLQTPATNLTPAAAADPVRSSCTTTRPTSCTSSTATPPWSQARTSICSMRVTCWSSRTGCLTSSWTSARRSSTS